MKTVLLPIFLTFSSMAFAQTFNQAYADRANTVTQASINTHLTEFASYGIKTSGSAANNNAFTWLKGKYEALGYPAAQITEQSFNFMISQQPKTSKNLIVTTTGTKYPDTYVIICGHYDTVNGPGVNDNGSGTAIMLEAAKILKSVSSEYSIKYIHFSGEEQGLLGSTAYVNNVVNGTNPKMKIKLVINLDEVGGVAGVPNNKIYVEKDGTPFNPTGMYAGYPSTNNAASATASQELMNCLTLYSVIQPVTGWAERSDYMPFDKNNEVITGLYEFNQSSRPHTASDTYVNMDPVYVYNIARGMVAALQHFSISPTDGVLDVTDVRNLADKISLFPNPANHLLNIGLEGKGYSVAISDFSGKLVHQSKDQQTIDISKLNNGVYLLKVDQSGQSITKKFIVKK